MKDKFPDVVITTCRLLGKLIQKMRIGQEVALSKTNTRPQILGNAGPKKISMPANQPGGFVSKISNEDKGWIRNIVDSGFRAASRQAEVMFDVISDNQFVRVPFRIATEFVRNGATASPCAFRASSRKV